MRKTLPYVLCGIVLTALVLTVKNSIKTVPATPASAEVVKQSNNVNVEGSKEMTFRVRPVLSQNK